jgi:hypothetical protein
MTDDKKDLPSLGNLAARVFRASGLILGAVIALNIAIVFVEPLLPWIIGGIAAVCVTWIVVAVARWRRSRW